MTTNPVFRGVATALITPTTEDGVDYGAFGRLIDWQIEEGINALVIAGTTGANQKVWHEKPISKAHGIIDTDLARDNLENDIPFADLQDL